MLVFPSQIYLIPSLSKKKDKWVEHLAVVEMLIPNTYNRNGEAKYELQIRSFFVSINTGKKTWDEPPSGAERIEYATDEVREMAEAQKRDLECVDVLGEKNDSNKSDEKSKRFGFRIKNFMNRRRLSNNEISDSANRKVKVREGSEMDEILKGSFHDDFEKALANSLNEASDMDKALARSINDVQYRERQMEEDEELALAKALSLSMNQEQQFKSITDNEK